MTVLPGGIPWMPYGYIYIYSAMHEGQKADMPAPSLTPNTCTGCHHFSPIMCADDLGTIGSEVKGWKYLPICIEFVFVCGWYLSSSFAYVYIV